MACLVNYVRKKCFHFAELELLYIEMINRAPVSCLIAQAALFLRLVGKGRGSWTSSAAQKIKKLSETPVTVHNIAKLCVIDGKNREITKKLVQPVPPHPCWTHGNFNGKMGHFGCFGGYQKWHLGCPNQNSKTTFQYKYPP